MKKTTRILLLVLVACFIFASCDQTPATGKTGDVKPTGKTAQTADTGVGSTEEDPYKFEPVAGLDFGGEDFTILVPISGGWSQYLDFTPTEKTEDAVSDANYERKQQLKELYNVNITEIIGSSNVAEDAKIDHKAGNNTYDAIHVPTSLIGQLAQGGYLVDLKTLSSVHLENPWYNQNAVRQLSIGGKLFFTLGDISIVDNDGIATMMFHKGLIEENNLTSPYKYIQDDEWTFDNFYALCKGFASDANGDGNIDMMDNWGYLSAYSSMIGQLISCGVEMCTKDENDLPVLSIWSDRNAEIVEKVLEMYIDNTTTFHVDQIDKNRTGGQSIYEYGNTMFMENRLLFRQTAMYRAIQCRQMEEDFGIIPYPKYDKEQKEYKHTFSTATPVIAILNTADDPESNGAVIEALSYYGRTIVLPEYKERLLKGIVSRDEESEFCLDIIFDSADYDLGNFLGIGGYMTMFANMCKNKTNSFASDYDKGKEAAEKQIQDYIDGYASVLG